MMHKSLESSQLHRGNQRIINVHSSLHCNHIAEKQCISKEHVKHMAAQNTVNTSTHTEQGCLVLKKVEVAFIHVSCFKNIKTTALFSKLLGLCFLKIFISLQSRRTLFLSIHQCRILSLLALSQTVSPHQKDTLLMRLCLH